MSMLTALLLAAPAAAGDSPGLMSLRVNLMFWTLIIFGITFWVLRKYAFAPILAAVEAREKSLEDLIEGARRDRAEAERLLLEHRAAIDNARSEAQKFIADARVTAEKMRADLIEQTHQEQQEMLARARRDIETERDKAIAELRREAVELAIAGATKVIEHNLDSAANRKLVEGYLGSIHNLKVS